MNVEAATATTPTAPATATGATTSTGPAPPAGAASAKLDPALVQLAEEVEVLSPHRYRISNEWRDLEQAPPAALGEDGRPVALAAGKERLLAYLASELYQRFYRRPLGGVAHSMVRSGADHALLARLSAANQGHGTWQPGWRVVGRAPDGLVAVRRDGEAVTAWARDDEITGEITEEIGGEINAEAEPACRVRIPKEILHRVLGYYLAIGDAAPDSDAGTEAAPTVRLYWHLDGPESAMRYIELVTSGLNRLGVPFRAKVIAHSALYLNADAGVLYLAANDYARVHPRLARLHGQLAGGLREQTPLFTRRLAPGLGLAEDPGDGTSFGQSRCRIAAVALWRARAEKGDVDARIRSLVETLRQAGLDPAKPWLGAGSRAVYEPLQSP